MSVDFNSVRTIYLCTCKRFKMKEGTFPPRSFQANKEYKFEKMRQKKDNKVYLRVYFDYHTKGDNSEYFNMFPNTFNYHFNTNGCW